MIEFTVYGQPVPQGSKKAFGRNVVEIADVRLRSWRHDVAVTAKEAMNGASPLVEPVEVRLMFFLPRPKGHFGSGRNAERIRDSAPAVPGVKPDLDKLTRSVLDALTGTVIRDDSQVVGLIASKLYDDQGHPGLMAQVTVLARRQR